jgi:hypothetical protein
MPKKIINKSNVHDVVLWLVPHLMGEVAQGKEIGLEFKELKAKRSISQNRLMWKWHGELREHIELCTGQVHDNNTIHELIVSKLGNNNPIEAAGEIVLVREQTRKMNIKRFTEFLNNYERWARERFNCNFSHPDDLYWQAIGK